MPKVVGLLMEGLLPLSKDARKYFKKKLGDDYEIYIGMDEALCLGDEMGIQLVGIMIPIAILIAFLPGVHMFPLSTLGSMVYITCACAMYANGDMFKALIASIAVVVYKTYINTWMAPIVRNLRLEPDLFPQLLRWFLEVMQPSLNCVLVGILGKFLKVW